MEKNLNSKKQLGVIGQLRKRTVRFCHQLLPTGYS